MNSLHHWTLEDKKVLIVDDDNSSRILADVYLRHTWIDKKNISFARDGLSAIKMLEKELFDVIIMDIYLPWISWIETSQMIKDSYNWGSPRLVAYTADMFFDRKEAMKELFDAIIIKPVAQWEFTEKILPVLHIKDKLLVQKN